MSKFWRSFSKLAFVFFILSAGSRFLHAAMPRGVDFCVSTSAHQIEGENRFSDWWVFEQKSGVIKNGDRSGKATDHLRLFRDDVALMKSIGVKRYRFSIEWARLEPREGEFDEEAADWYRSLLSELKSAGVEPMVTLHHFTLPQWVREKGGWEWAGAPERFNRYVEKVVREIAPDVRDWNTFNEPMVHLVTGYMAGVVPPQSKDLKQMKVALVGVLKSHALAYETLHRQSRNTSVRVGVAHHLRVFEAERWWNPFDQLTAFFLDKAFNWAFIDAIETGRLAISVPGLMSANEKIENLQGTQDFMGVNYYSRDQVYFTGMKPQMFELHVKRGAPVSDMGWEIYPDGFSQILVEVSKRYPKHSILVTENGIADNQLRDSKRIAFVRDHLSALKIAIDQGAKVETYCYWSLLDNFEWVEGFSPRFGLFHVDYSTFKRTPRESVEWIKALVSESGR